MTIYTEWSQFFICLAARPDESIFMKYVGPVLLSVNFKQLRTECCHLCYPVPSLLQGIYPDLLATSGDYLRVWRAGEPETKLECLLNNNKNSGNTLAIS